MKIDIIILLIHLLVIAVIDYKQHIIPDQPENIMYIYCISNGYSTSVGRIGKYECDFILRDVNTNYSYVQVSYTIA